MGKKTKTRQKRGTGGLRYENGAFEGTYKVYREDGTCITKSFRRKTENEINDIKANLRVLGIIDNNVEDIIINKRTNKLDFKYKGQNNNIKLAKNMLVKDYIEHWLVYRKAGIRSTAIKDTTFEEYTYKMQHISNEFGNREINTLTFEEINNFLQRYSIKYCTSGAKQLRNFFKSLLALAKEDGVITTNVLERNKVNFRELKGKKQKKIIDSNDYNKIIDYCINNNEMGVLMILLTGIRASEMAGITWENIDWEKCTLEIEKAYMKVKKYEEINGKMVYIKTVTEFVDLKSTGAYRTLRLEKEYVEMLKEHLERQKKLAQRWNKKWTEKDFVFTGKTYKGYLYNYTYNKIKKIMNELKIKNYKDLSTHNLRHSFISRGLENGVGVEKMQKIAGHSNIQTTIRNIYTLE